MSDPELKLKNACAKNRAEELGFDVWKDFVIPLFYDQLDLGEAKKPRLIVGGRGCGKTMLLRYLSHYSTFSANRPEVPDDAIKEVGLYWKVDTHFLNLMAERGLPDETWTAAFDHFLAITIAAEVLRAMRNIARSRFAHLSDDELNGVDTSALGDFDHDLTGDVESISRCLQSKERTFQAWVNNPRKLAEPIFLPGRQFVLALLEELTERLPALKSTIFFLYIDEYENLREYQQRLVNTYVKHSEPPLIFNIAIKRNGMRTRKTVSDESITDIADYRTHDLDAYLLEHKFPIFAAEVLFLRFATRADLQEVPVDVDSLRDPSRLGSRRAPEYQSSVVAGARRIFPDVTHQGLAEGVLSDSALRGQLERSISQILKERSSNLDAKSFLRMSQPEALVIVPALLHRESLEPAAVLEELDKLDKGIENRFTGRTNWVHNNFIGCLLQLYAPYSRACPFYAGFDTFTYLAAGNLRHFLELCHKSLKTGPEFGSVNDLHIPANDQAESAKQASAEFLREVRSFGRLGNRLHSFVLTLGSIFALAHRRPTQSEPEISHFSVQGGLDALTEEEIEFFAEAVKWSVLSEQPETKVKDPLLQPAATEWVLSPIYSPYFHITYRKRRKLDFTIAEIRSLIGGDYDVRRRLLKGFIDKWKLDPSATEGPFSLILKGISGVRIKMRRADTVDGVEIENVDLAFIGSELDGRGEAAHAALLGKASTRMRLTYDCEHLCLACNNERIECDDFSQWLQDTGAKSVLLEATTLGFPEILLGCRALKAIGVKEIAFLYVEPGGYSAPRLDQALHKRDFDLSHEVIGYGAIPGSAFLLDESCQQVIFFCGYEGERLDQAFESLKVSPERCSIVFGVPAFRPGWEMNTFANTLPVIRDRGIKGGVSFCGADNPAAAHDLLLNRYRSKKPGEQMFIAPIGTKPHGIGAAIFATEYADVGVLYDHPQRRRERTQESARWHLYSVDWSDS